LIGTAEPYRTWFCADAGTTVKFTIEIYSIGDDGSSETILRRTTIVAINPLRARKEAQYLLSAWKRRHANGARVINSQGQTVYNWSE
jgi:hypothetical protein